MGTGNARQSRKVPFGFLVVLFATGWGSLSAAPTGSAEPDPVATERYLQEEQFQRERQRMQDQRELLRDTDRARQQDLQDRIQQRRDDMIREMNRQP